MAVYSNNINVINNGVIDTNNKEVGYFKRKYIGSRDDYFKAVVPLINVDNSQVDRFSYTSGRLEMIRGNGCCYQGDCYMDFKIQKAYNSNGFLWTEFHVNRTYANPCTFTYNGQKWAGMHIYYNVQAHEIYFSGFSTESLNLGYITYYNTSNSTVTNSEIYNSLVIS